MSAVLKDLIAKRARAWEQTKEILERAATEERELNADEQTAYDKADVDLRRLDESIDRLHAGEQRAKDVEESFRSLGQREKRQDAPDESGSKVAEQLRTLLRSQPGASLEIKPDAPLTADMFRSFGQAGVEARALSKLTAGAGGNLVGTTFVNRLLEHLVETASLVGLAQVITTARGEQMIFPKTTSHGTAALVAEAGTIPQSDPAFGQGVLDAYKYGDLIQMSHELVNDTAFDLEGYVARQAGRAVGNAFGAHLMSGTGSNQPNGLVAAATLGKTGGTGVGGAFTADDLIDLKYSVTSVYRTQATGYMLRDASVAVMRKLKDSTGQYLWQPSLQAGAPNTFDGERIYTEINMPAVGVGLRSVLYGDFSAYVVRMVEGLRFERSLDFAFNTDLITYRCLIRGDGDLMDTTGAVKAFQGGAS